MLTLNLRPKLTEARRHNPAWHASPIDRAGVVRMSDDGGLADVITEEVTNQVGIAELLGDGSLEDELDGGDLGAAVGRTIGEQFGRELGAAIGREIHETLGEDTDEARSLSELRSDVMTGVRDGFRSGIGELGGREALASLTQQVADGTPLDGVVDQDESTDDSEPESADESSADEESAAEGDTAGEDESTAESDEESAPPGPADADLDDLRRETLEDFLGVMAYEDLQSIAKDVGVKANLSREEMTERIVETVTDDKDESSNENGSSNKDGSGDGEHNEPDSNATESADEGQSADEEPPAEAD